MDMKNVDSPVSWMVRLLRPWLEREDSSPGDLIQWSQGYGIPPVGHEEEPYIWLLRAAETLTPCNRDILSARLREVLTGRMNEIPNKRAPEQAFYNLLMLAAGLGSPAILGEPLFQLLEAGTLSGEWLGVSIRSALRAAIIMNQVDERMAPHWRLMLTSEGHGFLPGNVYSALEGIIRMPVGDSNSSQGRPDQDLMGAALKRITSDLEGERDALRQFRRIIGEIQSIRSSWTSIELDLVHLADRWKLPGWAVRALPSLNVIDGEKRLIWGTIAYHLQKVDLVTIAEELCEGEVVVVRVEPSTKGKFDWIISTIESARISNPYSSPGSLIGVILHALTQIESNEGVRQATQTSTGSKGGGHQGSMVSSLRRSMLAGHKIIPATFRSSRVVAPR